jgi:N-acetylglucosamine-6-sulfatase
MAVRSPLVLAVVAIFYGCGLLSSPPEQGEKEGAEPKSVSPAVPAKPNIVFILTDDMRKDDLKYMPKTRSLLQERGMSFQNAFVSNPICCPSRATIMRGQYAHNDGVWNNENVPGPSSSGWHAYHTKGRERDDLATRLHAAGYRTGLFGKYLNGYKGTLNGARYVPQGWDRWFATWGEGYYGYNASDDGTRRHFGTSPSDYETDVLSRKTDAFIDYSASLGRPFFAYVAPKAPHKAKGVGMAVPAPRYRHAYDGLKAPRLPSFNEKDVSDKPPWIRSFPRLSASKIASIDKAHERRAESLQAVDDLVEGVVNELRGTGQLTNTYLFFTSDNGWHEGEHRIPGEKMRPYEEDLRMPLLVRGPGVASGSTTYKLALNTDYLPTFTSLAGARRPSYVDGRSLRPVLKRSASVWRHAILLESPPNTVFVPNYPAYRGIRTVNTGTTTKSKYVEYAGGRKELHRLKKDPYERTNRYHAARAPSALATRLRALKTCAADACRAAENRQ